VRDVAKIKGKVKMKMRERLGSLSVIVGVCFLAVSLAFAQPAAKGYTDIHGVLQPSRPGAMRRNECKYHEPSRQGNNDRGVSKVSL